MSDKRWHLPVRLAIVSMTITVALIAVLGMVGLGLSLGAAILLGSGPCEGLTLSDRDGDPGTCAAGTALELCAQRGFALDPASTWFLLSRSTVIPSPKEGMALWRERLFGAMTRNARTAGDYFNLAALV